MPKFEFHRPSLQYKGRRLKKCVSIWLKAPLPPLRGKGSLSHKIITLGTSYVHILVHELYACNRNSAKHNQITLKVIN